MLSLDYTPHLYCRCYTVSTPGIQTDTGQTIILNDLEALHTFTLSPVQNYEFYLQNMLFLLQLTVYN